MSNLLPLTSSACDFTPLTSNLGDPGAYEKVVVHKEAKNKVGEDHECCRISQTMVVFIDEINRTGKRFDIILQINSEQNDSFCRLQHFDGRHVRKNRWEEICISSIKTQCWRTKIACINSLISVHVNLRMHVGSWVCNFVFVYV